MSYKPEIFIGEFISYSSFKACKLRVLKNEWQLVMYNELLVEAPYSVINSNIESLHFIEPPKFQKLVLNREQCVHPVLINSFLRLLRHGSDDIINQKLNKFSNLGSEEKIKKCNEFVTNELFQNWGVRSQVINFCSQESKMMKHELDLQYRKDSSKENMVPEVDPRLDPYGARQQAEEKAEHFRHWSNLENWLKDQQQIEYILKARDNSILRDYCGFNENYIEQFKAFKQ